MKGEGWVSGETKKHTQKKQQKTHTHTKKKQTNTHTKKQKEKKNKTNAVLLLGISVKLLASKIKDTSAPFSAVW